MKTIAIIMATAQAVALTGTPFNSWNSPEHSCESTGCTWKKQDYEHKTSFYDNVQLEEVSPVCTGEGCLWRSTAMVQLESDPICSSAGCTEHKLKKSGHPMDYFVPNFGVDHDILHTYQGLDWAEKNMGRKFTFPVHPDYNKKPVKPTFYLTDVPLDEDIVSSISHMTASEKKLGAWTLPALAK